MQYIKRTRWLSSVFLCFSILILYIVNILIEGKEDTQQIFSPDPCCYAHPSYILMTRNFLKTQKLLDPSSSQLSGNWFEQEPAKFSPRCQTRSFSILHSNDVSRFPIVSIQVKFHSCPAWSSVIIALAWMSGWQLDEMWNWVGESLHHLQQRQDFLLRSNILLWLKLQQSFVWSLFNS